MQVVSAMLKVANAHKDKTPIFYDLHLWINKQCKNSKDWNPGNWSSSFTCQKRRRGAKNDIQWPKPTKNQRKYVNK